MWLSIYYITFTLVNQITHNKACTAAFCLLLLEIKEENLHMYRHHTLSFHLTHIRFSFHQIKSRHENQSENLACLLCLDSHARCECDMFFTVTAPRDPSSREIQKSTQKIASFSGLIFCKSEKAQRSNGRSQEICRDKFKEGPAQQIKSYPEPVTETRDQISFCFHIFAVFLFSLCYIGKKMRSSYIIFLLFSF